MNELLTVENSIALVTLTALEIVLGIDNVVFIAILAGKLPEHQQESARRIGLGLAMVARILLLLAIGWVMSLTQPLFSIPQVWEADLSHTQGVSGRDLILLVGGLFLIGKATYEIHDKLEGSEEGETVSMAVSFGSVILQIILLDMVFSLDSVITAVGMVQTKADAQWIGLTIMITAIIIAVTVMLVFAEVVSAFVKRHPTMKILALSFLILIGVMLVVEAFHAHVSRGYIYFAMAFSLVVEIMNIRMRKVKRGPVELHQSYVKTPSGEPPDAYSEVAKSDPRK